MNIGDIKLYQEAEEKERERERNRLMEGQQLREQANIKKYGVADPSIRLNLYLPLMTEAEALRLLSNAEKQIKNYYNINKYRF